MYKWIWVCINGYKWGINGTRGVGISNVSNIDVLTRVRWYVKGVY